MKVALVIPVWNDPGGLVRLLVQAQELAWVHQIVVYDDASDAPCGPGMPGLPAPVAQDDRILWLRGEERRGAGHARNRAVAQVTCDHMLFFDSDDLFLAGMGDLIDGLRGRSFDFCLFRHVERRAGGEPLQGEDAYWDAAATGPDPAPLAPEAASRLCRIAAYPWNKIYRTAFLRDAAIHSTEIAVHNDIELHWLSFLRADRILTSRIAGCEHFVAEGAGRLTNRRGQERLDVFRALEAVQDAIMQSPRRNRFLAPFVDFCLRLAEWIDRNLEPGLRPVFHARLRGHLRKALPAPVFTLLALQDPALAGRVIARIDGAAA